MIKTVIAAAAVLITTSLIWVITNDVQKDSSQQKSQIYWRTWLENCRRYEVFNAWGTFTRDEYKWQSNTPVCTFSKWCGSLLKSNVKWEEWYIIAPKYLYMLQEQMLRKSYWKEVNFNSYGIEKSKLIALKELFNYMNNVSRNNNLIFTTCIEDIKALP